MTFLQNNILSLVVFTPLIGALFLLLFPRAERGSLKSFAIGWSTLVFVLSLAILYWFDGSQGSMQLVERHRWIPSIGAGYHIGVDGISVFLLLLSTLLTPIALLGSMNSIQHRVKEFVICMLLLETGMLGALVSLDLLLFYLFWEIMLIPMYFLIGIWGYQDRVYAALKFFVYTMVGSLMMLFALLYIYSTAPVVGERTFDLPVLIEAVQRAPYPIGTELLLFAAFALSFAIKVPMFPFHTWLPLAHVQAPTAGSVILAGVLLKMGTYGFLRFAIPIFPEASYWFIPPIAILALIGIIYGALVAMVQKDIKALVAYTSISHLGFVMLGIAALETKAITGAVYQMLNHGISTGALFLLVGVLYERRHTRLISEFGGVARVIPIIATVFLLISLSSIGLPGLNGFVGEFLILIGTFGSTTFDVTTLGPGSGRWLALIGASGVILAAVYLLWMFRRVFFGPLSNPLNQDLKDMTLREGVVFAPLVVLAVVMGVVPGWFLQRIEPSVQAAVADVQLRSHMHRADAQHQAPAAVAGAARPVDPGRRKGDMPVIKPLRPFGTIPRTLDEARGKPLPAPREQAERAHLDPTTAGVQATARDQRPQAVRTGPGATPPEAALRTKNKLKSPPVKGVQP
ncbi:MAG: NADH-quinone oxidoreductase subunit M [Pseudomonadota bacterium]